MSKKPTRRKTTSKQDKGTGKAEAESPSTESGKAVSETTEAEGEGTAKKSSRLPAFGFAADLLGKSQGAAQDSDEPTSDEEAAEGDQSQKSQDEVRAEPNAPAVGHEKREISSTDPERIFRFAESIESSNAEDDKQVTRRMGTWVSFALAGETFALPVEPVREVVRVSSITRVPHAPKPIRGVTNLRGRVIPVIDLRLRIDLPPTEFERTTRIIVVTARGRLIGLLVDAVQQVVHLDLDQVHPPPDDVMTVQSDYISGVYHFDDHLVLLLNVERALVVRGAEQFAETPANAKSAS